MDLDSVRPMGSGGRRAAVNGKAMGEQPEILEATTGNPSMHGRYTTPRMYNGRGFNHVGPGSRSQPGGTAYRCHAVLGRQ